MRKKYLSALLFGALLVTSAGTFTSCKDYDDEINDLQEQIDKLATKEDMEAKLSQMQAAIDAAKATAEDALAKAEAAGDTEEIESLKARIQALEDAAIDVEALKNEISTAVDSQLSTFRTEIEELLAEMEEKLGLTVADMVTSVELVFSDHNAKPDYYWENYYLGFSTAIEKENVFGKGLTNEITFVKGNQVQTGDKFIVKVSPVNAVLTPEMISFVNSKGENLDDFVKVTNVKKYDKLLTTRSSNNTGLWEVSVELNKYDEDGFEAITKSDENADDAWVLFAVRVNNTLSTVENREVVSSYSLYMNWNDYEPAENLNYFVDNYNISTIKNRYGVAGGSKEYVWNSNGPAVKPITEGSGVNVVEGDNRSGDSFKLVPAVQGEEVTISLTTQDDKVVAPTNIKAMYVVLDKDNAVESAPSEINAWNSYTYTGLNTVVEGTSTKISINSDKAINDIIGFRVYAVNYDGTLVDPDGKAFYVKVGSEGVVWNAASAVLTPTSETDKTTDAKAISLSEIKGASTFTWKTDKVQTNDNGDTTEDAFTIEFVKSDGTNVFDVDDANATVLTKDNIESIAKFKVTATQALKYYKDGQTYNGVLEVKNADGFVLATLNVSFTKELPTKPEGFSIKTNQLDANGVYNCYLVPDNWVAPNAANGTMDMDDVFNWGSGTNSNYTISFAASRIDASDNNKVKELDVTGNGNLTVAKSFIDNKTQHATTVTYDYGKISSEAKDENGAIINYVVELQSFPTVFNCIYNDTYTWKWATIDEIAKSYGGDWAKKNDDGSYTYKAPSTELVYGTDRTFETPAGKVPFSFNEVILGTSTRDGKYSAWLSKSFNNSLQLQEISSGVWGNVISDGNKVVNEYFKVVKDANGVLYFDATQISDNTNPTAPVASTLQLKYKDMYGHDIVIELPMTVVPR